MTEQALPELIVCAACELLFRNGSVHIVTGARHYDYPMRQQLEAFTKIYESPLLCEQQGFLTNRSRFIDRKTAMKIAKANGQIRREVRNPNSDELFSEHLY